MGCPENGLRDFEIVQAVQRGEREAYAGLVRRHQQGVFRLCLAILLNKVEAEDAAQETFFKAFVSLERYTEDHSFQAWLCRIASNHCLDLLRKRTRQRTDSLDGFLEAGGDQAEGLIIGQAPDTASPLESGDKMALAAKALSELSPSQRQILVLREIEGLSYDQIVEALGCTLDAVKARLRRARQALQSRARHFSDDGAFNNQKDINAWTIKR